jgi:hypothetical protein
VFLVKNKLKRIFDREKLMAAIKNWKNTSPKLKRQMKQNIKVPVYIPIPIFSYQQVPGMMIENLLRYAIFELLLII